MLSSTGAILEQQRYLPFGQPRAMSPAITSTDFTYTGQRSLPDTGLMDYKARFYSPSLGRFIQPDTIIPSATNPQSWNHFTYANNNPIRLNDPSGHCSGDADNTQNPDADCWAMIKNITETYDFISIDSANWTTSDLQYVDKALHAMESSFGGVDNLGDAVGNVSMYRSDMAFSDRFRETPTHAGQTQVLTKSITIFDLAMTSEYEAVFTTLHEFGHVYDVNNGLVSREFKKEFWPCSKKLFGACLQREAPDDTITGYGKSLAREDFADTFAVTIFEENFEQPNMNMPEYPPGVLPLPGYAHTPSPARKTFIQDLIAY